VAAILDFRSA